MKILVNLIFLLLILDGNAQNKYWIFFTDKCGLEVRGEYVSEKTRRQRIQQGLPAYHYTDIPVCRQYMKVLENFTHGLLISSKWLNGVSAHLTSDQKVKVAQLPFVRSIQQVFTSTFVAGHTFTEPELGYALKQIRGDALLHKGLTGRGISIGIIDGGFLDADSTYTLRHIFQKEAVQGYRDYLTPFNPRFSGIKALDDGHGTEVWELIAGYKRDEDLYLGLAIDAHYYLARTDHEKDENRKEEDNWVAAMEWMDSCGVRIINTSLGYNTGFDNPEENYRTEEMDGKTTVTSKAARIAVEEKGLLIVVAAGNEGRDDDWLVVSAPADVEGVLSVGATRFKTWSKVGYSSIGPEFLPYLKPNVSCYSSKGTSFSAPVITGLAACLMQYDSSLTNYQIMEMIEQSGHLYPYGNNYVGHGVPDGESLVHLLEGVDHGNVAATWHIRGDEVVIDTAGFGQDRLVVYHKKDERNVIREEILHLLKQRYIIQKPPGALRTTLAGREKVVEIFWE